MNKEYFRTTSFRIASFLFAKDFTLVGVNKLDHKTSEFVFIDTPEREALIHAFDYSAENDPQVVLDARKLYMAEKTLKEKLYRDY